MLMWMLMLIPLFSCLCKQIWSTDRFLFLLASATSTLKKTIKQPARQKRQGLLKKRQWWGRVYPAVTWALGWCVLPVCFCVCFSGLDYSFSHQPSVIRLFPRLRDKDIVLKPLGSRGAQLELQHRASVVCVRGQGVCVCCLCSCLKMRLRWRHKD